MRTLEQQFTHLETMSGVRQGCILASAVFWVARVWILIMSVKTNIDIDGLLFDHLVYADDTGFVVEGASDTTNFLLSFSLSHSLSVFGLCISYAWIKLQSVGSDSRPDLRNVIVGRNTIDRQWFDWLSRNFGSWRLFSISTPSAVKNSNFQKSKVANGRCLII